MIGLNYDENFSTSFTKFQFKSIIKQLIKQVALIYLLELKFKHSKIKDINYDSLSTQEYLISSEFTNDEVNLIYLLRSRTINCKSHFKSLNNTNVLCDPCLKHPDDQRFFLKCEVIKQKLPETVRWENISHNQLFPNMHEQKNLYQHLKKC